MNDELKLGFVLELENSRSPIKNKNITSKRKLKDTSKTPRKKKQSTLELEGVEAHPLYKKQKRTLTGMKATELHAILQKDYFTFCQEQGLLAKSYKCHCGNEDMRLRYPKNIKNLHFWVCQRKDHTKKQGIKKGTVFENSKLSIPDTLWIMYMWLYKYSTGLMMHESNNGPNTIIGLNRRCTELCQMILEFKDDPLGGEGKVVEVFECKFNNIKLGYEEDDKWAFCALEQDSRKTLLVIVDDRTSDAILQLFDKYILHGTLIVSMFWSPYTNLTRRDFHHLTREVSLSFYDITTKVTMDTYEAFVKGVNRPQPLTHLVKNEYEASFFEKMYRKSLLNAPDAYLAFLQDVALIYKPQNVAIKMEPTTIDDE